MGDLNARLFTRNPEEVDHIGPFIFNPDGHDMEDVPETQLENREMLVEFCLEEDYVVSSTWFQKDQAE